MNGKGDYFMELLLQKYAFYVNCNFKIHCEIVNWTSKRGKFSYFENSKIEMQELKLENELTKSKTKLENATLKSDIRKIESDT